MTTQGYTPSFLRKSAQAAGRTLDSCDPEKERVRKSLKTQRDECEEWKAPAAADPPADPLLSVTVFSATGKPVWAESGPF
jgi:hypothetical protein